MGIKVMVMAGGTGGHIFPALAVADELRARGADVVWLGTPDRMEAELVPAAGYPIEWISVQAVRGGSLARRLMAPFRVLVALLQAWKVLRRQRPAVVLGMGGFASGPGGVMAWLTRIPLLVHEQNAIPGFTNRVLSRLATRCMEAFPGALRCKRPVQSIGNPVRESIAVLAPPQQRFAGRSGRLRLLVLGGSQGAASINRCVPAALQQFAEQDRPQVWHQCGERTLDQTRSAYEQVDADARVDAFVTDMAEAYAWADLVVCRAGALTIAELAAAGVASILVPYPHAVDDHQTHNAAFLADAGAARILQETGMTAGRLHDLIVECGDREGRALKMAMAARARALPDAARLAADACLALARGGSAA